MKIIFLDIDGVLNTPLSCISSGNIMAHLCPTLTGSITRLCEETGAKVVISSTWRTYHTFLTMYDLLVPYGLAKHILTPERGEIVLLSEYEADNMWRTDQIGGSRGQEIEDWLEKYGPVESYVIIDDDSDMLDKQKTNFVKTNGYVGITFKDWEKARHILDPEYKKEKFYGEDSHPGFDTSTYTI